jgi:hypothetical protein
MRTLDENQLGSRLDSYILRAMKYTIAITFLIGFGIYVTSHSPIWILITLLAGVNVCAILMLVKGGVTGKRYAQGAKARRKNLTPLLFNQNDGLEDEAFRYFWSKSKKK